MGIPRSASPPPTTVASTRNSKSVLVTAPPADRPAGNGGGPRPWGDTVRATWARVPASERPRPRAANRHRPRPRDVGSAARKWTGVPPVDHTDVSVLVI